MKRRAWVVAFVAVLSLSLLPLETAGAHTVNHNTRLTIGKAPHGVVDPNDKVLVFGRLWPVACRDRQQVTLWVQRPGDDRQLDSDRLDGDGEYAFRVHLDEDKMVYARVEPTILVSNYLHSHRCQKARSETVLINVS